MASPHASLPATSRAWRSLKVPALIAAKLRPQSPQTRVHRRPVHRDPAPAANRRRRWPGGDQSSGRGSLSGNGVWALRFPKPRACVPSSTASTMRIWPPGAPRGRHRRTSFWPAASQCRACSRCKSAWFKLALLAYNLASAIKGLCFAPEERTARFKKYRLLLVHLAGCMSRFQPELRNRNGERSRSGCNSARPRAELGRVDLFAAWKIWQCLNLLSERGSVTRSSVIGKATCCGSQSRAPQTGTLRKISRTTANREGAVRCARGGRAPPNPLRSSGSMQTAAALPRQ